MRFFSHNSQAGKMLVAAILSICASSLKKISIYNEEMIVARCFIGFILFSRKSFLSKKLQNVLIDFVLVFSFLFFFANIHKMFILGGGVPLLLFLFLEGNESLGVEPLLMGEPDLDSKWVAMEMNAAPPSVPKLDWEIALELPDETQAPPSLVSRTTSELFYLFNIGRKNTLTETKFLEWIEPLALNKATVGFSKRLLVRITDLKIEHYNKGNHTKFLFRTEEQKERLYSVMWEE